MKSILCCLFLFCALSLFGCGAVQADAPQSVPLPVIMYHSVLKDPARTGTYVITPDALEGDLMYLQENGYTTVLMKEVLEFVAGTGDLPDLPVLLTFDDGYYNNLTYLLPLLEKYDMKAVISVVGEYTQKFSDTPDPNPNYAHLSWEDIALLQKSGRVEIQNHTWDMHKQGPRYGCMRMRSESLSDYRRALYEDVTRLNSALLTHSGVACTTLAYPYGKISAESRDILQEAGIQATLSSYERITLLTPGEPDCLFCIGRYNRPGGMTTGAFMKKLFPDPALKNP